MFKEAFSEEQREVIQTKEAEKQRAEKDKFKSELKIVVEESINKEEGSPITKKTRALEVKKIQDEEDDGVQIRKSLIKERVEEIQKEVKKAENEAKELKSQLSKLKGKTESIDRQVNSLPYQGGWDTIAPI